MNLPSGTITFLFTDIEGSTKLWERCPDAMRIALTRHDALLRELIERRNGYVFKTVGDAFCAAFPTAVEALQAALDAHITLLDQEWDETGPIRVRMGLHTGAAHERDNDYFGPTLNRTARLQGLAYGGQTLLSQVTYELVRDDLPEGASLKSLGLHRLKDLQRPEYAYQLLHPRLPQYFPPLKSLDTLPNNLPQQMNSFIGREQQMLEVGNLLPTTRLVTLVGTGGTGKTRLSLQVGAEALDQYADGVWLVELAPITNAALISQAILAVLGAREEPGRPHLMTLTEFLKSKSLLLLLDNCEHLVEACARIAETLLTNCPHLRILATSREALGIAGERTYHVPSLSLPNPKQLPSGESRVTTLTQYEAVRLFLERAVFIQPGFTITHTNAPAVAQICHRLDGIPLAIELAAARVKVLPPEQIASRLDDRFRLLTGGSRTALPRQQTLRALIDWSYTGLSKPEQLLLQRLSVFAGGWTLEAAESVCAGSMDLGAGQRAQASTSVGTDPGDVALEAYEILDLLTQLVDKSLVVVDAHEETVRYRLLETIRQYGAERLRESGLPSELLRRHLDFFLTLADQGNSNLHGPEQPAWMHRLELEHDNFRIALEFCRAIEDSGEAGLRLTIALSWFWYARCHWSEGRACLENALERGLGAPIELRAQALSAAANLADEMGDDTAARALLEECLELQRELGHRRGIAHSLHNLGVITKRQGNYAGAQALYEQSLAFKQELGDTRAIAKSLNNLGTLADEQGDYERARALLTQSLAMKREAGDTEGTADTLHNLASTAFHRGDNVQARLLHEECLALCRQIGYRWGAALALESLGAVALRAGDHASAQVLCTESLALYRELDIKTGVATVLHTLGRTAYAQGNAEKANLLLREGLALHRQVGDQKGIADFLEAFADLAEGREQADSQTNLDGCVQAVHLLGAAEWLRNALGTPHPPVEQEDYLRLIGRLRTRLGEDLYNATIAEGQTLTLEQAVSSVLEKDRDQILP